MAWLAKSEKADPPASIEVTVEADSTMTRPKTTSSAVVPSRT